ncbi:AAA family ATPase [Nonomuraea sp. 3N208]|uniref:AAA family ATPase n=1 Tax=Nonomuraea sp. 3N208 TaxID=3457421 RepID=UPI003FD30AC3
MVLAGRERELGELTEVFESAMLGRGGVAVISGPVGSGRTVLLHEFGRLAGQAGARVLYAECSPAERYLAGGVVGQLLGAMGQPGSRGWPDLLEMAQDVPTVLAIDDVDWADDTSLEILLSVVRRLRTARLLVAMTTSPDRRPFSPVSAAEELLHRPYNRRVELAPLSPAMVRDLIAERMGRQLADQLAGDTHRLTGGSPLLVRAIMKDLEDRGEAGAAFGDAVAACVHRCGATVIRVAEAIAVLGAHASTDMVSELASVGDHQAERVTRRLERAGVLTDGRFGHEVGRRAVIDRMSATRRTQMHRLAAQLLHIAGRPVTDVAACLLTAGWSAENWAARVLVTAGRQHLHDEAPVVAVRCFELALASGSADAERMIRKALSAQAEGCPTSADAGLHLSELLLDRLPEPLAADMCRRLSWRGRPAATARAPRQGWHGTPYPGCGKMPATARGQVERSTRSTDPKHADGVTAEQRTVTVNGQAPPVGKRSGEDTRESDLRRRAELLSEAERRVAVRAAQGRTNREIAEELYITRSTVEQHLTRIYRKLQVRTKEDLGRLAAALPFAEDDIVPC